MYRNLKYKGLWKLLKKDSTKPLNNPYKLLLLKPNQIKGEITNKIIMLILILIKIKNEFILHILSITNIYL